MSWRLIAIVLLAGLLRLVWLDKYPAGFTPDEAAFGYNAYSILKTGKDEWGTLFYKLPFTNLRSFGDYRYPAYVFLTIPSVAFLGLNEISTRLPNAILGTLSVISIYLLAAKLFPKKKPIYISEVSALLIAVSPWHVSLSRGAFETNALTFFIPLAIYGLLSGKVLLSSTLLAVNFYTYAAARFLTLPLVIILLIFFAKNINKKLFIISLIVLVLPGLISSIGKSGSRVSDVGIFNPTDNWREVSDKRFMARGLGLDDKIARIFNNKVVYLSSLFTANYLSYLSPQFLFTSGAGEGNYGIAPGQGLIYYFEIPLMLASLVYLIRHPSKKLYFIALLILISPIAAAMSKGPGYAANRAALMIPFLALSSSIGLFYILDASKKFLSAKHGSLIFILILTLSCSFFLENYLYNSQILLGRSRNYGIKELTTRLKEISEKYDQVNFSRSLSEPHIFVAFYTHYDPRQYQQASALWPRDVKFLDQYDGYFLGKYRFGDLHLEDKSSKRTLYVGKPQDFPPDYPEYFHIDYLDGQSAIKVAQKLP